MLHKPPDARSYAAASEKLLKEGFRFNPRTCWFERGPDRLTLRWNGRVYARRPVPASQLGFQLMPIYTLAITAADGHQHTVLSEFANDETAIGDAAGVLTADHPAIAVARGAGGDAEFLGVWDWCDGAPRWTGEE